MTTPTGAIAGLSERLRRRAAVTEYCTGDPLCAEAAAAIDALQARVRELDGYRGLYEASKGAVIREQARALRAEQERDQATACCDSYVNENQQLHDRMEKAQQERDEAYERAAEEAELHPDGSSDAIAAAIRRLADHEKERE